jgi:Ferritin-like domain
MQLEHLENVFYKEALHTLSEEDFMDAGYDAKYYSDLKYIAFDEEQHVKLLTAALNEAGVTPNKACEYKFGFDDVCLSHPPLTFHII